MNRDELNLMTVKELKDIATSAKLTIKPGLKKQDIVDAICKKYKLDSISDVQNEVDPSYDGPFDGPYEEEVVKPVEETKPEIDESIINEYVSYLNDKYGKNIIVQFNYKDNTIVAFMDDKRVTTTLNQPIKEIKKVLRLM